MGSGTVVTVWAAAVSTSEACSWEGDEPAKRPSEMTIKLREREMYRGAAGGGGWTWAMGGGAGRGARAGHGGLVTAGWSEMERDE